jgi:hypothetical protein
MRLFPAEVPGVGIKAGLQLCTTTGDNLLVDSTKGMEHGRQEAKALMPGLAVQCVARSKMAR